MGEGGEGVEEGVTVGPWGGQERVNIPPSDCVPPDAWVDCGAPTSAVEGVLGNLDHNYRGLLVACYSCRGHGRTGPEMVSVGEIPPSRGAAEPPRGSPARVDPHSQRDVAGIRGCGQSQGGPGWYWSRGKEVSTALNGWRNGTGEEKTWRQRWCGGRGEDRDGVGGRGE